MASPRDAAAHMPHAISYVGPDTLNVYSGGGPKSWSGLSAQHMRIAGIIAAWQAPQWLNDRLTRSPPITVPCRSTLESPITIMPFL